MNNIPKKLPPGTTIEQWAQYEADLAAFETIMRAKEPVDKSSKEYSEWQMSFSCDAPDKPGYYRANND